VFNLLLRNENKNETYSLFICQGL